MKDVTVNIGETNAYATDPLATLNAAIPPVVVQKEGRDYIHIQYEYKLSAFTRIIDLITAFVATVFTLFIGLFSSSVRNLWSEGFSGKEVINVFEEAIGGGLGGNPNLPLSLDPNAGGQPQHNTSWGMVSQLGGILGAVGGGGAGLMTGGLPGMGIGVATGYTVGGGVTHALHTGNGNDNQLLVDETVEDAQKT